MRVYKARLRSTQLMNGTKVLNTTTSTTTTLSTGQDDWDAWDIRIGVNDGIFMLLGFSIGSLATAVCFMATRKCKKCKKRRRDDDDDEVV